MANALMIAFAFGLPYHVLRTAAAAGTRVHVLGHGVAGRLRTSRCCASYRKLHDPADEGSVLADIEAAATRHRIDIVFPSDDVSTRLLARLRDRLPVRTSPLPDLAVFDLLNDKWNFTRYCHRHGVRVPPGWCFASVDELRAALASRELDLPITVKPINRSGGVGVVHIRDAREYALLGRIDYRPVLVQRHIIGETVGISAVCRDGRILAHAAQRRDERRFELFAHADLLDNMSRLVAATRLDGPANFDAVIETGTGLSYIVECNPRYWFTIYLSMLVGLNFMTTALEDAGMPAVPAATLTSEPLELAPRRTLQNPLRARRHDWRLVRYHLGDPIPYLLTRAKLIDDSAVAVGVAEMSAYSWPDPAAPAVLGAHP